MEHCVLRETSNWRQAILVNFSTSQYGAYAASSLILYLQYIFDYIYKYDIYIYTYRHTYRNNKAYDTNLIDYSLLRGKEYKKATVTLKYEGMTLQNIAQPL